MPTGQDSDLTAGEGRGAGSGMLCANASEKMAAVRAVQGRDRAAGGGVGWGDHQPWVCPACQVRFNYSSNSLQH